MSAIVPVRGAIRQLDRTAQPNEQVTPKDVSDGPRMARVLTKLLSDVSTLLRLFRPRRLDFEDIIFDATGTKVFRFEHKFKGRVRFWVTDWVGAAAFNLRKDASSDLNTLALTSTVAGTATVRVEESG